MKRCQICKKLIKLAKGNTKYCNSCAIKIKRFRQKEIYNPKYKGNLKGGNQNGDIQD